MVELEIRLYMDFASLSVGWAVPALEKLAPAPPATATTRFRRIANTR
ncbi:MAG: hypothetical protein HY815_24480 [Candidatus Riflebacteria bacterium]|nr:hypothetical protein [Candidatus Riflebacteria bacterium]